MTDDKTCPLCGAILIPRYSYTHLLERINMVLICPDCIPPEAN